LIDIKKNTSEGARRIDVMKRQGSSLDVSETSVVTEAPLEIRLKGRDSKLAEHWMITMRTPGQDEDLIRGMLFTSGCVTHLSEIEHIELIDQNRAEVTIPYLGHDHMSKTKERQLQTSSCGLCGARDLAALTYQSAHLPWSHRYKIGHSTLVSLPEKMRAHQKIFAETGGIHAAALFDVDGTFIDLAEDIGRHNALDKLIGSNIHDSHGEHIILLSGRMSYELIQKCAMIGMPIVAAIGPPSTMAIDIALEEGMTLVGFLRNTDYNVYTGSNRIKD